MKFTTLFLFVLFLNTSFSQVLVSGKVLDSESKITIPFVNIGVKGKSIGTVSGPDGRFELDIKKLENVVTFSAIGFATKSISGKDLKASGNVNLTPKNYQIETIEISSKGFGEEQMFGVKNETRGKSIGFGSSLLGTEFGAPIKIVKPTYIKSANFVINHAKGDSMFFRINIYKFQDEEIGENILKENILIMRKQEKGTVTIDLSAYNIVLESDVLLALEWIKDDNGKGNVGLTFDTKKGKKIKGVYLKNTSMSEFNRLPVKRSLNPCFYFIGKEEL